MKKQIIFTSDEHKKFYNNKIMEYSQMGRTPDSYIKSLFYLLSMTEDTRRNFDNLYNVRSGEIIPNGLKGGWLTETTKRICQLGFNLYNGWSQEGRKKVSENYTPYYLFANEYAKYFVQAIQLRYPEYFRTCLQD